MENAQLITLSRVTALNRQMNVVANNLANINTTGYKSENLLFEEYISPVGSADAFKFGDRDLSFVLDDRTVGDFSTGPLRPTGNQLDVAIQGEGFFVVQTPAGERYTRAGAFTLDAQGQLVTHDGFPVLGDGGPIQFDPEDTKVTIHGDGTITGAETEIGRLRVVTFDDPQLLNRIGSNLFSGQNARQLESPRLSQFALEGANIDAISQISQMIEVQRAYDELANIMRQQNDLRETAIQRLGRVQINA
ncbi:MAG: flagellar basal-body rod protein FlgF [Rhizobiales bacterium]|nr:flagellar basal-body rod protein FlgF [Hyphomicrobiales bacterium]